MSRAAVLLLVAILLQVVLELLWRFRGHDVVPRAIGSMSRRAAHGAEARTASTSRHVRPGAFVSARTAPLVVDGFYGSEQVDDDISSTGIGPYDTSTYGDNWKTGPDGFDSILLANSTTGDMRTISIREFLSGHFLRTWSTWAWWTEQETKYNRSRIDSDWAKVVTEYNKVRATSDEYSHLVSTHDTIRMDLTSVSNEFSSNLYLGWDGDNPTGSGAAYANKNPAYFHLIRNP